jgi:hypothetical protein
VDEILTDLSPGVLGQAVKNNLYAFFREMGRAVSVEVGEEAGLRWWHAPVAHAWFRGVLSLAAAENDETDTIERMTEYFRERNALPFTWWLAPDVPNQGWDRALRAQGLAYHADTPGMALALKDLPGTPPAPAGLEIRPVDNLAELRVWTRTFVTGYGLPDELEAPFYEMLAGMGLDWPVRNYLGYLEGEPAATSSVYLGAGVAGIQCVATVASARGRGLGGAMTLRPLYDAQERGYRAGILQSSQMGYKVYLRLGFAVVCTVDYYERGLES